MNRKKLENIESLLQELSVELHGQYTEYSDDTVILTVPVDKDETEFQSVKGYVVDKEPGKQVVILTGTVCTLHDHPSVDYLDLLKRNYQMVYCKLTITDEDYLEVEAATYYNYATADEVEAMIKEVATRTYELKKEFK
ncbi:hypothetical protein BKI52_07915 [marine bacterium AO1-C]|nr:hypothetical protein BKI52_07915 [marine bacterium AO1-C]